MESRKKNIEKREGREKRVSRKRRGRKSEKKEVGSGNIKRGDCGERERGDEERKGVHRGRKTGGMRELGS